MQLFGHFFVQRHTGNAQNVRFTFAHTCSKCERARSPLTISLAYIPRRVPIEPMDRAIRPSAAVRVRISIRTISAALVSAALFFRNVARHGMVKRPVLVIIVAGAPARGRVVAHGLCARLVVVRSPLHVEPVRTCKTAAWTPHRRQDAPNQLRIFEIQVESMN